MGNGTAPAGLYIEFQTAVLRQLPRDLPPAVLKRYVAEQEDLQRRLRQALVEEVKEDQLLQLITTVRVPGAKSFAAADHFKVGETEGVRIGRLGDNFKKNFLGKVEEDVAEAELKIHKLLRPARDEEIRAALGANHESTLAHLWRLLKLQPKGEDGVLLTNGYVNVCYIPDIHGIIWAVDAYWDVDSRVWAVEIRSFEYPYGWGGGARVVSR